jgi:hypothetical protein
MVLLITTYCAKVILGLSSQNQLPTHLFRDAGLLRRIGYTARQVEEGFCQRGKRLAHPIHKNTLADALERLTEEESQSIFNGSVVDLVRAKLVDDNVFSLDGSELHTTEHYPGAGQITMTRVPVSVKSATGFAPNRPLSRSNRPPPLRGERSSTGSKSV